MKPALLMPAARQDRRDQVLYDRTEAGAAVAKKLVEAMKKALQSFPRSFWYFERADHVLVVPLGGQRQDPEALAVVSD